jgi:hypothetical protein
MAGPTLTPPEHDKINRSDGEIRNRMRASAVRIRLLLGSNTYRRLRKFCLPLFSIVFSGALAIASTWLTWYGLAIYTQNLLNSVPLAVGIGAILWASCWLFVEEIASNTRLNSAETRTPQGAQKLAAQDPRPIAVWFKRFLFVVILTVSMSISAFFSFPAVYDVLSPNQAQASLETILQLLQHGNPLAGLALALAVAIDLLLLAAALLGARSLNTPYRNFYFPTGFVNLKVSDTDSQAIRARKVFLSYLKPDVRALKAQNDDFVLKLDDIPEDVAPEVRHILATGLRSGLAKPLGAGERMLMGRSYTLTPDLVGHLTNEILLFGRTGSTEQRGLNNSMNWSRRFVRRGHNSEHPKGLALDLLLPPSIAEEVSYHLHARYQGWVEKYGESRARLIFAFQSISAISSYWLPLGHNKKTQILGDEDQVVLMTGVRLEKLWESYRAVQTAQEDSTAVRFFVTSSLQARNIIGLPTYRITTNREGIALPWPTSGQITPVTALSSPPKEYERADKFEPSPQLIDDFFRGLTAQYELNRNDASDEFIAPPTHEYASAVLSGRIVEIIASRALRMREGLLQCKPLFSSGSFEYGFMEELSAHIPYRLDESILFFWHLHRDLVNHLSKGGVIQGRWGHLELWRDQIDIVLTASADRPQLTTH